MAAGEGGEAQSAVSGAWVTEDGACTLPSVPRNSVITGTHLVVWVGVRVGLLMWIGSA